MTDFLSNATSERLQLVFEKTKNPSRLLIVSITANVSGLAFLTQTGRGSKNINSFLVFHILQATQLLQFAIRSQGQKLVSRKIKAFIQTSFQILPYLQNYKAKLLCSESNILIFTKQLPSKIEQLKTGTAVPYIYYTVVMHQEIKHFTHITSSYIHNLWMW